MTTAGLHTCEAARADGDADSDIDIMLIRPPRLAEESSPWADQIDRLREIVPRWTGNRCHALQLDLRRLREHVAVRDPLIDEWQRDAIPLDGETAVAILRQLSDREGD